jgi:hypothetical protein|tara:strand:+ start:3999 stop:4343 length:345 start_codon:yes stop_codon:yes gene_type:complete
MPGRKSKAKGRRLQNLVRDKLREAVSNLEDDDIKSQTMGMTGEDIVLSPAAKKLIPYSFECKNVEKLNIWSALEQTSKNCEDRIPALVFTRNYTPTYVALPFEHLIELIKRYNN